MSAIFPIGKSSASCSPLNCHKVDLRLGINSGSALSNHIYTILSKSVLHESKLLHRNSHNRSEIGILLVHPKLRSFIEYSNSLLRRNAASVIPNVSSSHAFVSRWLYNSLTYTLPRSLTICIAHTFHDQNVSVALKTPRAQSHFGSSVRSNAPQIETSRQPLYPSSGHARLVPIKPAPHYAGKLRFYT